jgi:MIP family channel proteins
MFNPKVFVAEFIGTFALVFVGAAAGIYSTISSLGIGMLGVALAYGLIVAVLVYAFGPISGAHINPAVTLAMAINGTIKWLEAAVYWVAQLAGAVLAAFLLRTIFSLLSPDLVTGMATYGVLATDFTYYAMGMEALLTFFLVNTYLHAAVDGKAGQFTGLAIGMTIMAAIIVGAPLTGASLNPARSFGPAVFTSTITPGTPDFQNPMFYLIYFVGPFIGSIFAVLLYTFFKYEFVTSADIEDEDVEEVEVIVVEEEPVEKKPARKPATRKPATRKPATRKTTKK